MKKEKFDEAVATFVECIDKDVEYSKKEYQEVERELTYFVRIMKIYGNRFDSEDVVRLLKESEKCAIRVKYYLKSGEEWQKMAQDCYLTMLDWIKEWREYIEHSSCKKMSA